MNYYRNIILGIYFLGSSLPLMAQEAIAPLNQPPIALLPINETFVKAWFFPEEPLEKKSSLPPIFQAEKKDAPIIKTLGPDPIQMTPPEPAGRKSPSNYRWKKDIVTTTFWIGQGASGYNNTRNIQSAWDQKWTTRFGGEDNPNRRDGGFLPARFAAKLNPFYVALPFNDIKYPEKAKKHVPWWNEEFHHTNRWTSQCKGRWIQIRTTQGKMCYAQWEDVGPFRYDHAEYVFGNARPTTYNKAGLDISPAIKQYLNLTGLDLCDWRFVESHEVPPGPWLKYGEQAIIFAALKRARSQRKSHLTQTQKKRRPSASQH